MEDIKDNNEVTYNNSDDLVYIKTVPVSSSEPIIQPYSQVMSQRSLRYRINVSTSVKGIKTWDCTVDGEGYSLEEILDKSNELVLKLEQKYPIEP